MKFLVTGGAGFIGSNFIRFCLKNKSDISIVNFDKLTYAGNLTNLSDIVANYPDRYEFIKGDICSSSDIENVLNTNKIDVIVNFAAETHVDRSILDPDVFINTNIVGTKTLLDFALKNKTKLFIQISTDEVYGSLGPSGTFTEDSQITPNSPYSASKASADLIARSYHKTYGLPVIITRCSNNYGPYQFPEKLIPLMVLNAMKEDNLPVYGDGKNIRDWIYVDDHSSAVLEIINKGVAGEVYNIGGDCELENIFIVKEILKQTSKPGSLIEYVVDRPGHDRRYAIDHKKLSDLTDWQPRVNFSDGLKKTVDWYLKNEIWVNNIINKEYLSYYQSNYSNR